MGYAKKLNHSKLAFMVLFILKILNMFDQHIQYKYNLILHK